jgi:diguanylate cyclase (GGDEF)-like protein
MSGDTPYSSVIYPDDLDRVTREVAKHSVKGAVDSFEQEYRILSPSGEIFWVDDRTTIEKNDDGDITYYQGILLDITERKLMEEKLLHLSNHDPLTGLYNRRMLEEQLTKDIQRADRYKHPLSLFMVDIDHFKSVNDTHGHTAGDLIIKAVANVIEELIREIDYSCRYGGEEFAIVLPETSLTEAGEIAERLRTTIEEKIFEINDGKKLSITISIGVSDFATGSESLEVLINRADSALYAAKDFGRNCIKIAKDAA